MRCKTGFPDRKTMSVCTVSLNFVLSLAAVFGLGFGRDRLAPAIQLAPTTFSSWMHSRATTSRVVFAGWLVVIPGTVAFSSTSLLS
eukprot:2321214-Amphidinium_carterae.2